MFVPQFLACIMGNAAPVAKIGAAFFMSPDPLPAGVPSFGYHDGCGHQAGQYGHRRSRPGKGMTGGRLRTVLRLCCAGGAAGRLIGIGGRACTLFHQGIQRLGRLQSTS